MVFYGIDKFSLVDYDEKIACTLFTGGCNFKCPFCHNSSLVMSTQNLQTFSEEEIFKYLETRKGVIDAVVITGGEPTLHKDLIRVIKTIKEMGYLVKLDTNGTNPEMVKELVNQNLLDYVAMDIKNSKEIYGITVGLKNLNLTNIEKTVDFLMENRVDYEFRTTTMKEFHSLEDFEEIGKWLKGAKKYRIQKFIDNENCIEHGLHELEKENALKAKDIILKYIDDVELRSY